MRAWTLTLALATIVATVPWSGPASGPEPADALLSAPGPAAVPGARPMPLVFEENLGQAGPAVRFVARLPGYAMLLGPGSVTLHLAGDGAAPATLRLTFPGADPAPRVVGEEPTGSAGHHYRGSDPARWVEGARHFAAVRYEGLYPGIDLKFYANAEGLPEYDFLVAPGADPRAIRVALEGADLVRLDASGALRVETPAGILDQKAPVLHQPTAAGREAVAGGFVLLGPAEVGFVLAPYDLARPLVIDPVLLYSQTIGGTRKSIPEPSGVANGYERVDRAVVDVFGSLHVKGYTSSIDFPATAAPGYATAQNVRAGFSDLFVAKFDAFGALQFATYLGGSQNNSLGRGGIGVDVRGNIFAATGTTSSDFPMRDPLYPTRRGGNDVAIVKLHPDGTLARSTYFGGSSNDDPNALAVDGHGNVFVAGTTTSTNLTVTPGAFRTTFTGTTGTDAFVMKMNGALGQLVYGTYYGGSSTDAGMDLAVDQDGTAVLAGYALSTNLPMTGSAWQPAKRLLYDAFVAKFAPDGKSLQYATYLGGQSDDFGTAVALDAGGNVYLAGYTESTTMTIAGPAVQDTNQGGVFDAFLAKLSAAGKLTYSTYLGGPATDQAWGVAVDAKERAVLVGDTTSAVFPTKDAYNPTYSGTIKAFITRIDTKATTSAAALGFSTYFGGSETYGRAVAVDGPGNIYAAGVTTPSGYPRANQMVPIPAGSGYYDGWVAAFIEVCGAPPVTTPSVAATPGNAGWWRSNALVTLVATSASCPVPFTSYWLDGGPRGEGRLIPVNGDGEHTLVFHSQDLLGGREANKTLTLKLDATPPTTTPVITGLEGVDCWYRSPVQVTLVARDATSGPAPGGTFHSLNGAPWKQAATLGITASGEHGLRYYSLDTAGNREQDGATSICLDFVPPTVALTRPAGGNAYVLDVVDPLRPGLPRTVVVGTLEVRADAADDPGGSGVHRVELWVDGNLRGVDHEAPFEFTWRAGAEALGDHVLRVVAHDMAGNTAEAAQDVVTVPTRDQGAEATLAAQMAALPPLPGLPAPPPLPAPPELPPAPVAGSAPPAEVGA